MMQLPATMAIQSTLLKERYHHEKQIEHSKHDSKTGVEVALTIQRQKTLTREVTRPRSLQIFPYF